jgi:fructokinase
MMNERFCVVAVGEIIWDMLPQGKQLGGAPSNFSCHIHSLGGDARLISRIGQDLMGNETLKIFQDRGISIANIQLDTYALTGRADVKLSSDGQPQFTIASDVAWDHIEADTKAIRTISQADAICFGTLAQRAQESREAITKLLSHAKPEALVVLDINLRAPFWNMEIIEQSLKMCNVLKLNDQELVILAEHFGLTGDTQHQLQQLADRFHLQALAFTRGGQGSMIMSHGEWSDHSGIKADICDTVGAGDAFTATMIMGLLQGDSLEHINQHANEVAAYVCSQPGATPRLKVLA